MRCRLRLGFFLLLFCCSTPLFQLQAQVRPGNLPAFDSLRYADFSGLAFLLSQTAVQLEATYANADTSAQRLQDQWEHTQVAAKADTLLAKTAADSIAKQLKTVRAQAKKAGKQHDKAIKVLNFSNSLMQMDSLNLRKNLPKAWTQVQGLYDELYPPAPVEKPAADTAAVAAAPKEEPAKEATGKGEPKKEVRKPALSVKKYDPAEDVMLHPPLPPCRVASTSRDEFSGEVSRSMQPAELLRYTNPLLKNYLQGKTHIICEASLQSAGANVSLQLRFIINDPNARKTFGRLDKNSLASMKFMDGSTFTLQNSIGEEGVYNPENGAMTYRAVYPIAADLFKKMRHTELDTLRIAWSNGYDDYEVQQVDLLEQQSECLFAK